MTGESFFLQAFVYLAAAVVAVPIAKRFGLGSVLGYLIAGIVIGPFGLELVGEEGEDVMHFAEFGVVLLLFVIGLELQPQLLWRLRVSVLGLGGLQVTLTALAFTGLSLAIGLPTREAIAIGLILALSSTAIVLQTLSEKGLMPTTAGQSSFSVLLFQDMAVIPMLAVFPLLATHAADAGTGGHAVATTWVTGLPPWAQTLAVFGAVAAVAGGGHFLARPVLRAVARTRLREVFTAATLLLVIGIALLMTQVGLSPALGTFLAGVVLASSEYRHELESDIDPFKGLLLGLFFIAVGASIDFGLIAAQPLLIAGLVAAVLLIKFGILAGLGWGFGLGMEATLLVAFALPQVGEFAFVLLASAGQLGVLPASITSPLVAVVALSMALSPLLMLAYERGVRPYVGTREKDRREPDAIDEANPVIVAGFGTFGHITGRLLRANGVGTTVLDIDSDRVELLRKVGLKVYYGDATRHDLLQSAGAEQAQLLVLALDETEKTVRLVETARKHFPHLTILARVDDRADAYELLDAGVEHVYRETLDTSLQMGVDALRLLGFRAHQAHRSAQAFRRHDEEAVREMASMRDDHDTYINTARRRIANLEALLQADLEDRIHDGEDAWDTDSLREDVRQHGGLG